MDGFRAGRNLGPAQSLCDAVVYCLTEDGDIVGHDRTFACNHQTCHNPFRLVVLCTVQQISQSHACSQTEPRRYRLPRSTPGH